MKLFDFPPSGNGYKVRLALAHRGLRCEYVPVDILRGETRTPAFLARNPNGRIPLLQLDDGSHLAESNAILYYLAQGTDLWPDTVPDQARVLQWLFFEQYSHEPNIATARYWLSIRQTPLDAHETEALQHKQAQGRAALAVMDRHLQAAPFFVAGQFSIADIALYAYTHAAGEGGFDLADYPAVVAWLARVAARPRHVAIDELPRA